MSFSYGFCELDFGTAGNAAYNSLWQQGAMEGISEFVASGDQGAAACDYADSIPYAAEFGFAVSGTSSTPYNVAVGGTDFNWAKQHHILLECHQRHKWSFRTRVYSRSPMERHLRQL